MSTPYAVKEKIKYQLFFYGKDVDTVAKELNVTRRTVLMAEREESPEQYKTRFYMQRLMNQRKSIAILVESLDLTNITTMQLLNFISELSGKVDELSSREVDVYGSVLS